MKLYNYGSGLFCEDAGFIYRTDAWMLDALFTADDPVAKLRAALKVEERLPALPQGDLLAPIDKQEVWAAGVTYFKSREARMEEAQQAGGGSFYDRVYSAERPELFFKATPHRVAGSGQPVRIRSDGKWNVPEPELTLAINSRGKIFGYTVGNDMSSRDIEGENPLYLPQAKVYDKSCALGPCILFADTPLPRETEIVLEIYRGGAQIFRGVTSVANIKRGFDELTGFLFRDNTFPNGCFLMTGTGIVPPNDFTLQHGDEIRIAIAPIGTLVNVVA
ncbi:MAG TPA: fumarylacetoacetate hydrolase family protein [Planctomycetota bacterium]|nr:fumarylacetoacetate hydrolase family protein [Planctomycetota bacterium]